MKEVPSIVSKTEKKWLNPLFHFVSTLFDDQQLSSHDHYHHLRVWHFAKDLAVQVSTNQKKLDDFFMQDLLFACFFHDTGLTRTLDVRHGEESLHILKENKHLFPELTISENLAQAIVRHDDKSYLKSDDASENFTLLNLLTCADDLDAFGAIGAFRYAEIYFLRGINSDELKNAVLPNLENRFRNFEASFSPYPSLVEQHRMRFEKTKAVFVNANAPFLQQLHEALITEKKDMYNLINTPCDELNELCTFADQMKNEWSFFQNSITES